MTVTASPIATRKPLLGLATLMTQAFRGTDLRPPFEPELVRRYGRDGVVYFTDGIGPVPTTVEIVTIAAVVVIAACCKGECSQCEAQCPEIFNCFHNSLFIKDE